MQNLLIIEDDPDILTLLMDELSKEDSRETLGATDGEEGLRLFHIAPRPLVVLLDIRLPKKDGITVLKEILETKDKEVSVILMTAGLMSKYGRLIKAGMDVVQKPFDMPCLEYVVDAHCERLAG